MRKSRLFFGYFMVNAFLLGLMFAHAAHLRQAQLPALKGNRELVEINNITDLCLFTEARYTRHPSMADLHTPFQDYPMSLEHFPSGSIMGLPRHLKFSKGNLNRALD